MNINISEVRQRLIQLKIPSSRLEVQATQRGYNIVIECLEERNADDWNHALQSFCEDVRIVKNSSLTDAPLFPLSSERYIISAVM